MTGRLTLRLLVGRWLFRLSHGGFFGGEASPAYPPHLQYAGHTYVGEGGRRFP